MQRLIDFLVGLVAGVAIAILLPQAQKIINANYTYGKLDLAGVWESIMSMWQEARLAIILALVVLAVAIGLTVWQSFKPSKLEKDISQIKKALNIPDDKEENDC